MQAAALLLDRPGGGALVSRETPEGGGVKHDAHKPRWDLLPYDAIARVVDVFTHGARKYGVGNWERGIAFPRLFAATMRHLVARVGGTRIDPDSGLPHLAHAAANVLMALALDERAPITTSQPCPHGFAYCAACTEEHPS